jgi:hypothetical protein
MLVQSEKNGQVARGEFSMIPPPSSLECPARSSQSSPDTHTPSSPLQASHVGSCAALAQYLKDDVCRQVNATGCSKEIPMSLCLTQQFDSILCVGCGDDVGAFDGLQQDIHHVAVVTLHQIRPFFS